MNCRRCGKEIEKKYFCPSCYDEEYKERNSINWANMTFEEFFELDGKLIEKYKNVG